MKKRLVVASVVILVGFYVTLLRPVTWVSVSDAEAAAIVGGSTCGTARSHTCNGSHPQCYPVAFYTSGGDIPNQKQKGDAVPCGNFDIQTQNYCGWVVDTQDCMKTP